MLSKGFPTASLWYSRNCLRSLDRTPISTRSWPIRKMASVKDSLPHVVRTADDSRQTGLHTTVLSRIELVNKNIRLLRLSLPDGPVRHLPGQYVDLHIPEIETVGGFTITSPPHTAFIRAPDSSTENKQEPYIELAIQQSPRNPPAAFLYREPAEILSSPMSIRIGGNFTFPPSTLSRSEFEKINNIVLIAGGVGINPIMSMLSAMDLAGAGRLGGMPKRIRMLYSSRREYVEREGAGVGEEILFEHRLAWIANRWHEKKEVDFGYTFFETSKSKTSDAQHSDGDGVRHLYRRMNHDDIYTALGPEQNRQNTLVYVCGLPNMTDEYVGMLKKAPGLDEKRVLCEKWW